MPTRADKISLSGSISLGTGVMIGAGIFALVGQVAEFAGDWFPLAFLLGALVAGASSYSYVGYSSVNSDRHRRCIDWLMAEVVAWHGPSFRPR